jgi:high-affinity iron transporter
MQDILLISAPSFVIALRETIEAALIVGIVLAYLTKTDNSHLKKDVWIGVIAAVLASLLGALVFLQVYGGLEGDIEKLFEGFVMVFAVIVLSTMILWNFKHAKEIKHHLEGKVHDVISGNKRYAILSLVFIAVFREGIETVLFLGSILTSENPVSVSTGALLGIILAVILAIGLFQGTIHLNLRTFFTVTSVILILFAAGLLAHAMHEFQELHWFGLYGASESPLWNVALVDLSTILPDGVGIGAILRALLGYQDKPTLLEIVAYIGYIIVILFLYTKVKIVSVANKQKDIAMN